MTDGRLHVAGELDNVHSKLQDAMYEIKRVIVGQDQMLERVMVCLLGNGHLLLEGV
ncbi:MAG TPA: ATPase, partial [Acidimicrobiia bacterium]|nr:ATPase [Acidimicrobiia bacterium]